MGHQTRYANSYLQLRWLRCKKNAGMMVVNGTRDNEQKLKDRRFPLKIREDFSTARVTQHWHSLPREIVESAFLEMFKNPLDIALGNRCKWPCFSGEVGADDSQRFLPNLTTLVLWFCTFVPLFFFHPTSLSFRVISAQVKQWHIFYREVAFACIASVNSSCVNLLQ